MKAAKNDHVRAFMKWVSEALDFSHTGVTKIEEMTDEIAETSIGKNPNNQNGLIMGRMIVRLQEACSDIFVEINASQASREDFLFLDIAEKMPKIFERMGFSEAPWIVKKAISFLSSASLNWDASSEKYKEAVAPIFGGILFDLATFKERESIHEMIESALSEVINEVKAEEAAEDVGSVPGIPGTGFLGGNVVGQA